MSEFANKLTAAILVGGLGTRLRPVFADTQKVIAPVGGRPFLYRLLDQLADAGLRRVVLCTGYKATEVAAMVGSTYRNLSIAYSPEPRPLGTAGALRRALPLLDTETVLALNGDSFCEVDLAAFQAAHVARQANASLVVREAEDTSQSGRVSFDASGAIIDFIEKGGATGRGWINAGLYLLNRAVLESIPADRTVSIECETFPSWIGRGLYAFPAAGKFLDIGTPGDYFAAQHLFP
jgi:NDP-sugar pyrophosphorylase family protein